MDINETPLIAGHPALDFVNSVEGRGSGTLLNYLADYEKLAGWCCHAGLIAPPRHEALLRQAERHPVIAARVWGDAMKLRDGLNGIFRALAEADDPAKPAISAFNETLQQAFANRRLLPTAPGRMQWVWSHTDSELKVPLWEIVLAAADLMAAEASADRNSHGIKICANGPCDWMFLDTSRNGQRRWCRMSVCGNATKVRRFRERRRSKL